MKPHKSTIWIVLLGLVLAVFVVGFAQSATQTDQKKKNEASSCAMDSCCCKGDSCPMKKEGTTVSATDAKDHCCCCSGDKCDMKKMNGSMENHSAAMNCSCCGDSCDMKKMKDHGSAESCCCDMKMKHGDMKQMNQKNKPS